MALTYNGEGFARVANSPVIIIIDIFPRPSRPATKRKKISVPSAQSKICPVGGCQWSLDISIGDSCLKDR
jgi:hypothetical protein